MLVPVTVSFSHLNWHFPKILKTHDTPVILLVKSFHERNVIYGVSVVFQLQSTVFLNVSERACLCQIPIFLPSLFFFFSLSGRVKLSGSIRRVSAPQGKDYFIMKPTHMLVLLSVWLPNGRAPKRGWSLEVHEVWETPAERRGEEEGVWGIGYKFIA